MIYSRQYSRRLIVLQDLDMSKTGGRCVAEIKNGRGRLILTAHTLAPNETYDIYMVTNERNRASCKIGKVGSSTLDFDPDNIEGYKIEDIAAVAIVRSGDTVPLLAGYTKDRIDLHKGIYIKKTKDKNDMSVQNHENTKILPSKTDFMDKNESTEINTKENIKEGTTSKPIDFIEMISNFRREMEELDKITRNGTRFKDVAIEAKETTDTEKYDAFESTNESVQTDNKHSEKSDMFQDYLSYIKFHHENAEPYIKDNNNVYWRKITPAELCAIPEITPDIFLSPICAAATKKYGAIFLGVCEDNGKYIIGIPWDGDISSCSPFKQTIPTENGINCYIYTL